MSPDSTPTHSTAPAIAEYWPDTPAPGWLTEAERRASLDAMLADCLPNQPIWVFGYGSLLWRPAFTSVEHRLATLNG